MKVMLSLITAYVGLSITVPGYAKENKKFYRELIKGFNSPSSGLPAVSIFKHKKQVWLGECVDKMRLPGITYSRDEYYLPILKFKTAPKEGISVQFSAIDVGGNPYSSPRHIDDPEDAIWWLQGWQGTIVSLAEFSKRNRALIADYGNRNLSRWGEIHLRQGKLRGKKVLYYIHKIYRRNNEISRACYFDEVVLPAQR